MRSLHNLCLLPPQVHASRKSAPINRACPCLSALTPSPSCHPPSCSWSQLESFSFAFAPPPSLSGGLHGPPCHFAVAAYNNTYMVSRSVIFAALCSYVWVIIPLVAINPRCHFSVGKNAGLVLMSICIIALCGVHNVCVTALWKVDLVKLWWYSVPRRVENR